MDLVTWQSSRKHDRPVVSLTEIYGEYIWEYICRAADSNPIEVEGGFSHSYQGDPSATWHGYTPGKLALGGAVPIKS